MKTFKKLMAVLLSLLMIASVIVIPAAAEETTEELITKEVSIFDLSNTVLGEKVSGSSTVMPTGTEDAGISRFNDGGIGTSYHNGTQEIVEVDGKKALKVHFDVASYQNGWAWGSSNIYSIKVAIPAGYAPYVTGFKADITNAAIGNLAYRFGVRNASLSKYGFSPKGGPENATVGDSTISKTTSLNTLGSFYAATHDGASEGNWAELGYTPEEIILFMNDQSSSDGGTGYAIIKDIKIVVTGTEAQLSDIASMKKISLWDLSQNDLGATSSVKYPAGTTQSSYTGALEIVNGTEGKKALRFDFDNTAFTGTGDRFNEHNVRPLYQVNINVIPEDYIPYVEKITLKVNKQSSSRVLYSFGVTDGNDYSKYGEGWNANIAAETTGNLTYTLNVDNLYKCGIWQTGSYSDPRGGAKWNNDFTALYLMLTANEGATGYIDIEDIIITVNTTDKFEEEIQEKVNFENERAAYCIEDYENSTSGRVIESDLALSGKKLQRYVANGYNAATPSKITGAENHDGISFWVYNDTDAAASQFMAVVNGVDQYRHGFTIPSRKWTKIYLDFNAMQKKTSGDDWWGNSTKVSLTDEEKAAISQITFRDWNRGSTPFLIDDIYFYDNNYIENKTIELTEENVVLPEGATFADGKVTFAPGVADAELIVNVPAGTLSGAKTVEYHYTTSANAAPSVKLYMNGPWTNNASTNWTPWAEQIKRGEKNYSGSISANTSSAFVLDFTKTSGGGLEKVYTWYGSSWNKDEWMGTSTAPSEESKSAITQIRFRVFSYSEVDSGEYVTLDKLVITYPNATYTASADAVENGTVSVFKTTGYENDQISFTATPDACCEVESVVVTDAEGNIVPTTQKNYDAENLDTYYTFKQPASDATVSATFKVNHIYGEEVTDPTCQAEGYTTYTCANCGDSYTDNKTPVVDHNYVDGYCSFGCGTKEPAIVYTFGHTMQIKPSEPFGLFFNGIVYNDKVVVDYDTLSDYGMYIASSDDFAAEPTVEELIANGKVFKKGDANVVIGTSGEKAAICVTYDEAIYAYEMDKAYYAVFFAADKNGNVSYGEVKERSVNTIVDDYQNSAADYSEALINLCDKMDAMFEVTTSYRDARPERYEFNDAKPETFADKSFGAAATGDYTFGHTMQLASCEPWALVFNAAVRVNGNVIDYSACDEYGLIVSDKAFTSIDDVDASAYVYNNANGGATINDKGYISVDYMEGIYSSEMDKDFYAMFYVVIDGQYYYGAVKTRSMLSVANQYFDNAASYQDDVIALLNAMVDLYEANAAFKASALGL